MVHFKKFLDRPLGSLLTNAFSLIENVLKPLAKSVLITLGLKTSKSAEDVRLYKKILRSGVTTLIISNEETKDIIKKLIS